MILEHNNYRHYLKCELADRIAKNPSYSMRAFAKYLGLAPTTISEILSGKKNLSSEKSLEIASKLGLQDKEVDYFHLLVQYENSRNPEVKSRLFEKMHLVNPQRNVTDLSGELFRVISDWYHYAILMFCDIKNFEFTAENISRRLNISRFEIEAAIHRLEKLELIKKDKKDSKRYLRVNESIQYQCKESDSALRKYNRQLLELAIKSLENQPPKDKVFGSEIVAISKSSIPALKELTEEYLSKVLVLTRKNQIKTDIYHVGVQIFNLSHERNKE